MYKCSYQIHDIQFSLTRTSCNIVDMKIIRIAKLKKKTKQKKLNS